ncbi:hypothetical protein [Novosphingobium sp. P6W]|uniref:hypothetical protein n=1 Tax=Novosphingobium sp. P6W TaxID=1609758 RepID=UPI0013B3BCAF|nr:hypothetical protein [Novosphingobium sp. P6W]
MAVILIVVIAIAQCSSAQKSEQQQAAANFTSQTSEAIASAAPPAVAPLEALSIKSAAKDFRRVYTADALAGAMIFSQNCYEGLAHEFSWARLDECGAFDVMAVQKLDADPGNTSSEAAYFESETAAGRYLAAVISAGENPDAADQRLAELQTRSAALAPRVIVPQSEPIQAPETDTNQEDEAGWKGQA